MKTNHRILIKKSLSVALSLSLVAPSLAQAQLADLFDSSALSNERILKASSSSKLQVRKARVIVDNEAAFASKLAAINGAQKSIRMMYYIYSDDYTSSVLSEALIAAAQRGVKVEILLDYMTNYPHLDLLSAMEREGSKGQGSLQIRLYNRPTKNIVKDAFFMTSTCSEAAKKNAKPTACSEEKMARIEPQFKSESVSDNISNLSTSMSGLFLSGLYSKSAGALKTAVLEGGNIDLKELASGSESTPEERNQLLEFAKLLFEAQIKGDPIAKVKVALAFQMYGDQLNPIYSLVTGLIPIARHHDELMGSDWKHVTDFMHHKLLLVDDRTVQLGGRNIEDSYHVKANDFSTKYVFKDASGNAEPGGKKYLFMDTDVYAELDTGGEQIAQSFSRLFNFRSMVAGLNEVRAHAPNEMILHMDLTAKAIEQCQNQKAISLNFDSCFKIRFASLGAPSLESRMNQKIETMRSHASTYRSEYRANFEKTWKQNSGFDDSLTPKDVSSMLMTYIENIPYDKNAKSTERTYGSTNGAEAASGKYMHELLVRSLKDVCEKSYKSGNREQVLLHQGYVLFPSNITRALGNMISGEWRCGNVDMTIVTNSIPTTDLNVINFFARHQLHSLFQYYKKAKSKHSMSLRYFEHLPVQNGRNLSLHSKINIIGKNAIIGSMNADVRSYYMDSNNGFFIRGANDFTKSYNEHLKQITEDPTQTAEYTQQFLNVTRTTLAQEDSMILQGLFAKYDSNGRISEKHRAQLEKYMHQLLDKLYDWTSVLLSKDNFKPKYWHTKNELLKKQLEEQERLEKLFNTLYMLL